ILYRKLLYQQQYVAAVHEQMNAVLEPVDPAELDLVEHLAEWDGLDESLHFNIAEPEIEEAPAGSQGLDLQFVNDMYPEPDINSLLESQNDDAHQSQNAESQPGGRGRDSSTKSRGKGTGANNRGGNIKGAGRNNK
ncbi:unnamed protein product, partial [Amoebophrya sp. A25]